MAVYENVTTVSLIAGEDLRGDLGSLLHIENDGGTGKVIKTTLATQAPVGVLAENPFANLDTDGTSVPVTILNSVVKMVAGGSITAGQLIVADTGVAGRVLGIANIAAIPAGGAAVGTALESAVDGDVFKVLAQITTN